MRRQCFPIPVILLKHVDKICETGLICHVLCVVSISCAFNQWSLKNLKRSTKERYWPTVVGRILVWALITEYPNQFTSSLYPKWICICELFCVSCRIFRNHVWMPPEKLFTDSKVTDDSYKKIINFLTIIKINAYFV